MTEAASEQDFGITPELCWIGAHPNAECFLAWTLEVTRAMVRPRRAWADALRRCVDTITDASPESIQRFEWRMKREPFAFKIWTALIGSESEMVACEDAAELLYKFECRFPD
jgi:hypothetical protein